MNVYFSGRLLTATDLGAEQEAAGQRDAGAAVALNPQPLPPQDVSQLVQWVLRESYVSNTEDLRSFAEKVKSYNDAKKQVRDELHRTRAALGEVDSHVKGLEDKLDSLGEDAQLASVDLQNVLEKQQQTLQMMSNISKQVHDTMLNLVRKIGG
jgi:methyl-accepting chemotaxis protein